MMCSAIWSLAPYEQAADGRSPQRYMLALNRPTPVRSRFRITQTFRGRSAPGGNVVSGCLSLVGRGVCCQLVLHDWRVLCPEPCQAAAWLEKGRREGRRLRPSWCDSRMKLCRRWVGSSRALFTSRWVWCSLRRVAGPMPENTGRNSVGVGLRQPMIILRVSLSAVSSFFVCVLWHQTGEAYSAELYTRARAPVRRVVGLAPQAEAARLLGRRLFLEDTLARRENAILIALILQIEYFVNWR